MSRLVHILTRGAALAAVLLLLAGCVDNTAELQQWVAQKKADPGKPPPPLPVVKNFETFIYADQDMRDPFALPTREQADTGAAKGPTPDPDRVKEPLESFALDSLKMVGTIGADAGRVALILDPQGVIHQLESGHYAGQNYGHVVAISDDQIQLVELVPDGSGGWMERDAKIARGGGNP